MPEFKDISVQTDGVKIGWNIMATLSALGIGMYVYSVLAPIRSDVVSIKNSLHHIEDEELRLDGKFEAFLEAVDDRLHECETQRLLQQQRINEIERKINGKPTG